ncbi:transcription antitermination protein NusB [Metamycoplasma faucium]|uniref:Transcription antitermination protein NusB n=1 Tax=Metamycoplasma faucium TaxID=56142 RepID=A0ABZ2TKI4_9BACT
MENKLSNEDKKNLFLINSFNKRVKIITYIYQFELFDEKVNVNEIFSNNDLNNFEVQTLTIIQNKYVLFKNLIIKALNNAWIWERLQPLIRAILLYGLYELFINEPKVVINEMVNITKIYTIGDEYKLVNKVLDTLLKTNQISFETKK